MAADQIRDLNAALAGRYLVEHELGRGAMATVYLADDLKHRRQVAIKVLHLTLASFLGPDRFRREIEIAARLNHPHILALYDSDAVGGFLFYVMPYIKGESLRHKLERETQLPIDEAVRIARQVATALDHAHAKGVIHRDVKPENILLHEGEAVVADFGIALAVTAAAGDRLTEAGLAVGTPGYMSPEQALGEPVVDARTDVYSLGCILYEMLVGELPFTGPTALAVIAKQVNGPVPAVRRLRSTVPTAMEQALIKALARVPADRFASAALFAAALTEPAPARPRPPSVAVLPFVNLSADPANEYFADGMTEDVIAQLSKVRALQVISRTSVMAFKNRDLSLRDIAGRLNVGTLLEGSVRRADDRVRIVAQLIDADSDQHLWAETYDRRLTDIFAIQADVALQIAAALKAELSPDETVRIRKEPTSDLPAYHLYLQGRHCFTRYTPEGLHKAIAFYEQAIQRDPDYALAHVGRAMAYEELGETGAMATGMAYARARESVALALELDGDLAEAHSALAGLKVVSEFDWEGAEREFRRALELNPNSADTYDYYGRMLAALERYDEAIAAQTRAQELDPLAHPVDVATALLRAGRVDEAVAAAERAVEFEPDYPRAHSTLAWAYLAKDRNEEGLAELERTVALAPGVGLWLAQLGQAYAVTGDVERARVVLRELEEMARRRYVAPYHMAYLHTGLGDQERAMDLLEQAFAERAGAIYGIRGSFLFAPLRSHPRFKALLAKMNMTAV